MKEANDPQTLYRVAFKMKLHNGMEAEYKKRHELLWPSLQALLKEAGIFEYSIFLDRSTNDLFGFLKCRDGEALNNLPAEPVMQQWWAFRDIMDCNEDNSPVSVPLEEVFYLA